MIFKIGIFKNFLNFTEKHLFWSFFLMKLQAWRVDLEEVGPLLVFIRYLHYIDVL